MKPRTRLILCTAMALSSSTPATANSSSHSRRPLAHENDSPTAASPQQQQSCSLLSRQPIQLKGVPKLSERMKVLLTTDSNESDFMERLRLEEEQDLQQQALMPTSQTTSSSSTSQVLFWGLTGGMLLVLATASISSPAAASAYFWKQLVSTSMSLYWLAWVRPSMSWSDLWTPLVSLVDPTVRVYIVENVVPQVARTVKRVVIAELWNAYFRRMWKELEGLFANTAANGDVASTSLSETTASTEFDPTRWLYEKHKIVVDIIERGTKKVIQSSLQKQLQSSFGYVASTMMEVLGQASSRGAVGLKPGDFLSM